MKMKTSLLTIAAAMILAATAQARIGWNLEQCRANYGHEVKVEKAWCGGTAYGFINQGLYIYAIFSPDGKLGDVTYFDNTAPIPLSVEMRKHVWNENVDKSIAWDDKYQYLNEHGNMGWDGKVGHKSLGAEHFEHWTMREAFGTHVLIENANKNGWQIRAVKQFQIEQGALKTYPSTK
jgi:hypothetical protein